MTGWRHGIVLLVSLVGCRDVIGVDELVLVDGGSDSGTDAGADSATQADSGPWPGARCKDEAECRKCCKEAFRNENPIYERVLREEGCVCAGSERDDCTAECGESVCKGAPPEEANGPDSCIRCLDLRIKDANPACGAAQDACASAGCGNVVACLKQCR